MIIDDEANARNALAELLRIEGHITDVAADGQQALEMLERFDPDVVLTDLKMPVLDGMGLLKLGKPRVPNATFLVMTAFGSIDTAVLAIQAGAENYLTKPLDLDALATLVASAGEKAQLSRANAKALLGAKPKIAPEATLLVPGAPPPEVVPVALNAQREVAAAMSFEGFQASHKDPFGAFSPQAAQRFYGVVDSVSRRLHVNVDGLDQVPKGGAILVANHSFGFDVVFPMAAISRKLERKVWVLGEHIWWKVPFLRRFVASIGVVDGTVENLDRLLAAQELVLVLPGGMREALKPRDLRYQLLWGHRYGFVRAAIRHQVPLVPLAGIGADGIFDFVGNPFARGTRWLGRSGFPVPLPARILPIPHLSPLRFVFGEPIVADAAPDQAEDVNILRRVRREVEGALHELIERELAQRLGMNLD